MLKQLALALLLTPPLLAGCKEAGPAPARQTAEAPGPVKDGLTEPAPAQQVAAKASQHSVSSPEDYSEDGWKVIASTNGALGNNKNSAVLVLQQQDPKLRIHNGNLGSDILDTNPRKLVFLHQAGSAWIVGKQVSGWLPPEGDVESPCLMDPLADGGIQIEKGTLVVSLHYWMSCGSYGVTNRSFRFRPEGGKMRLIGYDRLEFSRATGLGTETSINYLTGRKKETNNVVIIGPEEGDVTPEPEVIWSWITKEKRWYLENLDESLCRDWDNQPSWC